MRWASILRFNRTLSEKLAVTLAKTRVTPNAVTACSLGTGLLAALCMSSGARPAMLAGALCLHIAFVLDSSDGRLARLTSRETVFGKWFDVISDLVVEVALWTGVFLAVLRESAEGFPPYALFWAACAGSLFNFILINWERKKGCSFHAADEKDPARRASPFFVFLESLSHNGASILLVWGGAAIADAFVFLCGGALFVTGVWVTRVTVNFRSLLLPRARTEAAG
jgi:phosphatidylglycerophosphate synthase